MASGKYVAQVSDRLLTDTVTLRTFDRTSNKNLVYITPDAQVAIGYSGMAYIEGLPTDQWIAQLLTGLTFSRPGESPRTHLGLRDRMLDVGLSCEFLRRELGFWVDRNRRFLDLRFVPQVVIGGWQFTRRTWRPIIWVLEYSAAKRQYSVARTPSDYWWFRSRFFLSQVPRDNELAQSDFRDLRIKLKTCHDQSSAEQALVSTVRSVAAIGSRVGPHCMSILLARPWENKVRVRYLPDETAIISEGQEQYATQSVPVDKLLVQDGAPVYFSPWLIFPSQVVPPSLRVNMGAVFSYGHLNVHLETPDSELPETSAKGIPTYDFGLVTPGMDEIIASVSYDDVPDVKKVVGHSRSQRRPHDPTRRRN